jgi:multidrug efflux pump subunit AcrA (membrane-fusion protein)
VPVEARVETQPSSEIFRRMPKVAAILLVAIMLAGCRQEVSQAAGPPPVTVAQPVKRTITEWDEFTGRFEAIEEVQVRARVGGFITSVEFTDGDMVHTGDLQLLRKHCARFASIRSSARPFLMGFCPHNID